MNISIKPKKNKKHTQLMLRVYYKRIDLSVLLDLLIDENDWNSDSQLTKSSTVINEKLLSLKLDVFKAFNEGLVQGEVFSKDWLQSVVNNSFNRPSNEIGLMSKDHFIYLSDFGKWWIKEKSGTWKTDSKNVMSKEIVSQYENFLELLTDFESENGKLLMKDLKIEDFYNFIEYLESDGYNSSTTSRNIGRMRFFCNRAVEENLKISNSFKQRIYIEKDSDEIEGVYLNEAELFKIHTNTVWESELYSTEDLIHAKDNLILSSYTSLRISDFMGGLDVSKIKDGVIQIRTQKTKKFVRIALHPFVKEVLEKRFGNLPNKFGNHKYNLLIKEVGRICGIDKVTYGSLWNADINRKELGYRPKYQYISSHIGRKNFVTNMRGLLSDEAIQSFGGWESKEMMSHYDQNTNEKYVLEAENNWNLKTVER